MEWKEVRLGDVCDLIAGFAFKAKDFGEFPTKVIKIGDIKPPFVDYVGQVGVDISNYDINRLSKYTVKYGDYVLAMTGATIGKVGKYISENFSYINQRVLKFSPKQNVDADFINYIICSNIFAKYVVNFVDSESAQPNISAPTISKFAFQIPSEKDDQRRIASILSSLDRKIELNNKINADLEEMAQAIFKNWFVDFEPFKDGKFLDSELGMIPEGWKVISLNEILDNVSGYSYKGSELQSSNIAMATIKNFERKGGFKTEGYKEIVISKKIKETQFVNMFDVLVAHTDLTQNAEIVGNPAIVLSKGGYEKLIMSMDLTKVISKIDGVTNGLLYCILSTSRFKEHALGYVNGTTVLHMSKKAVPEYTCAFPKDINQIRDLCITLDSIYKRMAVTYDENSRLSTLRDTLLPRLMSGEIEVLE